MNDESLKRANEIKALLKLLKSQLDNINLGVSRFAIIKACGTIVEVSLAMDIKPTVRLIFVADLQEQITKLEKEFNSL